jgi:Flp pilus assembly protein TadG
LKSQSGSINLIVVVFLAILISSLTMAVNIGYLLSQRGNLQKLVDQAALAATQEIELAAYYQNGLSKPIKLDLEKSQKVALNFIEKNSKFSNRVSTEVTVIANEISLNSQVQIELPLAPAIINFPVRASASAQLIPGF